MVASTLTRCNERGTEEYSNVIGSFQAHQIRKLQNRVLNLWLLCVTRTHDYKITDDSVSLMTTSHGLIGVIISRNY